MSRSRTTAARRGAHQWLALVIGAVYLVIGVVGFAITGFEDWTVHDHSQTLLGFAINPTHNVVHILVGLLGVVLWRTASGARTFGWVLVIGYGAVFVYGLFVVDDPDANFLNINWADNWLHLASVIGGLLIALLPYRTTATGADR